MALLTLAINPNFPIKREIISPTRTTPLGNGAVQARRRYPQPIYRFSITEKEADPDLFNYLWGFAFFHQGDTPFFLDPQNEWSTIPPERALLIGYGDGIRTQFFLPNRNITTGTPIGYVNGSSVSTSTDLAAGLMTFSAAPGLGLEVRASYECQYKCLFANNGDVLVSESNFASALISLDGITLIEIVP